MCAVLLHRQSFLIELLHALIALWEFWLRYRLQNLIDEVVLPLQQRCQHESIASVLAHFHLSAWLEGGHHVLELVDAPLS